MIRCFGFLSSLLFVTACSAAPSPEPSPAMKMVVVNEIDVMGEEAPPHGKIGMSTAYRISDVAPNRTFEFRKRALHKGAAVGIHPISHDEIYYVVSGTGIVTSDGEDATLTEGMSAYLYDGAEVGIKQVGDEPLVIIIAYPIPGHKRLVKGAK